MDSTASPTHSDFAALPPKADKSDFDTTQKLFERLREMRSFEPLKEVQSFEPLKDRQSFGPLKERLREKQLFEPLKERQSLGRRSSRRLIQFLVIFCIGVAATLAWQAYGDTARAMVASSSPQLGWLAPHSVAVAPTAEAVRQKQRW
jgi:hypothetical protein